MTPHQLSVRAAQAARLAARPRCRHGRLVAGGLAYGHLECRVCLPDGSDVADWVDAHPWGGDLREVAAVLGCTYQAVQQAEARAMRRLRAMLADGPPDAQEARCGAIGGEDVGEAGRGRRSA